MFIDAGVVAVDLDRADIELAAFIIPGKIHLAAIADVLLFALLLVSVLQAFDVQLVVDAGDHAISAGLGAAQEGIAAGDHGEGGAGLTWVSVQAVERSWL